MKPLAISLLICALSACGFHLRQAPSMSETIPDIELQCPHQHSWVLCQTLRSQLEAAGTQIQDKASYRLEIFKPQSTQRTFTLRSNASTAEYELSRRVSYRLMNTENAKIIAKNTISRSRIYQHQASALLQKDREKEEIIRSVDQDIANTVIRELAEIQLSNAQTSSSASTANSL